MISVFTLIYVTVSGMRVRDLRVFTMHLLAVVITGVGYFDDERKRETKFSQVIDVAAPPPTFPTPRRVVVSKSEDFWF